MACTQLLQTQLSDPLVLLMPALFGLKRLVLQASDGKRTGMTHTV